MRAVLCHVEKSTADDERHGAARRKRKKKPNPKYNDDVDLDEDNNNNNNDNNDDADGENANDDDATSALRKSTRKKRKTKREDDEYEHNVKQPRSVKVELAPIIFDEGGIDKFRCPVEGCMKVSNSLPAYRYHATTHQRPPKPTLTPNDKSISTCICGIIVHAAVR